MNSAGVMRSSEPFESGDMPGVNQAFLTFPLTIPLRPGICPDYRKSAIHLARVYGELKRGFIYFVSTVGRDEKVIRNYIKNQEKKDQRLDQLNLWRRTAAYRQPDKPGTRQRPSPPL